MNPKKDHTRRHQLVTPSSVKEIISKIEDAQLKRAQEDISIQLSDILGNVNGVISRFQDDLGSDLKERKKRHVEQEKGKMRFILLEKIASFSKAAETKERNLYEILNWMSDWGDSLSYETKPKESEKESDKQDEWVEVMEKVLPLSLIATEGGIESLISLCSNLIEEQKKIAIRPKGTFGKTWREKVLRKSSSSPGQPLSPEQMLKDENTTSAKVSEVQDMLQELLDSTMFNKGEIKAIKYIYTMVENLNQALILQFQQNHKLEAQCKILEVEMTKEINSQKLLFQKELQALEDTKSALERQVQDSEEKCQKLLLEEAAVKCRLQMGGGDRDRRDFKHFSRPLQSPTSIGLPNIEEAFKAERDKKEKSSLKEGEKEEEEEIFPKDSDDTDIPVENAVDEDTLKSKDDKGTDDTVSEKRGVVDKSTVQTDEDKDSDLTTESWEDLRAEISPEEMVPLDLPHFPSPENIDFFQEKQAEEERYWQERRKQWQAEEKRWQEQQKEWEQLEREHKEKQQQWKLEEEELYKKRQDYFNTQEPMKQRREVDDLLEQSVLPLSLSSRKGPEEVENFLNRVYHIQPVGERIQNPETNEPQLPVLTPSRSQWAHVGPMKLGPFACTGMSGKPLLHASPCKSSTSRKSTPLQKKEKYRVDVQGQRKNLLLLNEAVENMGLPLHLYSLAKKLIIEMLHTAMTKFGYLIQKYSIYRMFQCIRQEIITNIQAIRKTGNACDARHFYIFLEKTDKYQSRRLQTWTEKQKVLEQDRGDCLEQMMFLFSQIRGEWDLNLSMPVLIDGSEKQKKEVTAVSMKCVNIIKAARTQPKQFLGAKHRERSVLKMARQKGNEMETIWKADLSTSSYPIKKKTPTDVIWFQNGGYPDIPRMMDLDSHSTYHKSLKSLRTRSPGIFKRKFTTDPNNEVIHDESAEAVTEV